MNSDYKFQISVYLRLVESCKSSETSKKQFYENKIVELLENKNHQEKQDFIPDFYKTECHLICENILKNSEACDFKKMTIKSFVDYYPELKDFKHTEIGQALSKCGVLCKVMKVDGVTQRIRLLPVPRVEDDKGVDL